LKIVDFGTASNIPNYGNIFDGCSSIQAIVLRKMDSITTLAGLNPFSYISSAVSDWYFYVPDALIPNYEADNVWSNYQGHFKGLSEYDENAILNG
jgi:hypothetical protein